MNPKLLADPDIARSYREACISEVNRGLSEKSLCVIHKDRSDVLIPERDLICILSSLIFALLLCVVLSGILVARVHRFFTGDEITLQNCPEG